MFDVSSPPKFIFPRPAIIRPAKDLIRPDPMLVMAMAGHKLRRAAGNAGVGGISFVGSNTGGFDETTIAIPTHETGDLILILAYRTTLTPPSLPSGWTNIQNDNQNTPTNNSYRVGYRIATSSSTTSGTWSNANTLYVCVYRGVSGIGASSKAKASNTTVSWASLTLNVTDGSSWVVRTLAQHNTDASSPPSPVTQLRTGSSPVRKQAIWDSNGGTATSGSGTSTIASGAWLTTAIELLAA